MANEFPKGPEQRFERQRLEAERDLNERAAYTSTGAFGWWWAWFIVLMSALFIWFGGWGWWGYGGWWGWGGNRVVYVRPAGPEVAVKVGTLLGSPASFDGKKVLLPSTTVQEMVNPRTIWVGPNNNQRVLVSVSNRSSVQNLSQGQKVDVSGLVIKPQNAVQQNLGLSASDASQMKSDGVMLEAAVVTQPGQTQPNGTRP